MDADHPENGVLIPCRMTVRSPNREHAAHDGAPSVLARSQCAHCRSLFVKLTKMSATRRLRPLAMAHHLIAKSGAQGALRGRSGRRRQSAPRLTFGRKPALVLAHRPSASGAAQVLKIAADTNCVGMLGAERLLVDRQRPFVEHPRAAEVALGVKEAGEVVEVRRNVRMLKAVHFFVDRQRPLVERPRAGEIALGLEQDGEVVEALRGVGMLRAERLLADRERPLEERPRALKSPWVLNRLARLLRLLAIEGCSRLSAFSRIASARS